MFRRVIIAHADEPIRQPPNVRFIAIDDLNDWVGCLEGHPQAKTPNMDALAKRGVLFTNAHCQAPICGPSRASMLTGLLPTTSGIYLQINDRDIPKASAAAKKAQSMPDYFEKHGYRTLAVGKIFHNGDKAKHFDEYGGRFAATGPKPKERFATTRLGSTNPAARRPIGGPTPTATKK